MEEIIGEVSGIIYRNEENQFKIIKVKTANKEEITAKGILPLIETGDDIKAQGYYVVHNVFGRQFNVENFEKELPNTEKALINYIGNGLVPGIGQKTAEKIVAEFGEDTINVIKNDYKKIAKIKGVTPEKAEMLSEVFQEKWALWEIINYIKIFDLKAKDAMKLYEKFGLTTIATIQDNPYLIEEAGVRIEFGKLDRQAISMGFEEEGIKRVSAGIIHILKNVTYNGNTAIKQDTLIRDVMVILHVSYDSVVNALKDLSAREKIRIEKRYEENINSVDDVSYYVYFKKMYTAENNIAYTIKRVLESENVLYEKHIEQKMKGLMEFELSKKQKEALELVNENNISIITGGPGTGKTTIIKAIINFYKQSEKEPKIVLCAPTGRAAKRMSETTNMPAQTLHRLLEIGKISDDISEDMYTEVKTLHEDIVIVDELSMVDTILMNYLCKAITEGTKLILVGDIDQLASVGAGAVLKDMIYSGQIPYIALNQIFRQAAKSKIVVNAHKVNEGETFTDEFITDINDIDEMDDFKYIRELNMKKIVDMILNLYDDNTQIISPTKMGEIGTRSLNKLIQAKYNPEDENKKQAMIGSILFREGDKVMQTINDYDIEWKDLKTGKYLTGIFNGEMGVITNISPVAKTLVVKFEDDKEATYTFEMADQLIHSYAITVHKSQGSEFDKVIIPIIRITDKLLTRNVLYTAMTRAKSSLYILGDKNAIDYMVSNYKEDTRTTGLKYKLVNMNV